MVEALDFSALRGALRAQIDRNGDASARADNPWVGASSPVTSQIGTFGIVMTSL
jgi:hypothetical protein